nr:hypothetical protein [Tanacetum cinerariifolium]
MVIVQECCGGQDLAPLPPRDQRHLWLRYQVVGYIEEIVYDFDQRLETIFSRQLGGVRRSKTWRQFILALGLHTPEEIADDGFGTYWLGTQRVIPNKRDLSDYWVEISSIRDFFRGAPFYTYIRDPVWRMCLDLIHHFWEGHAEGRNNNARLSGGNFIRHLAHHFGLVSDDGLRGLFVVTRKISLIDIGELVKLNICGEIGDDWAWADLAPIQAPRLSPPPPAAGRTMP